MALGLQKKADVDKRLAHYSRAQRQGWRLVTDQVHRNGGEMGYSDFPAFPIVSAARGAYSPGR
jgi:hypothetical protein